jgi:Rrf2 family nitric oxide-sensitive transcriptional repressor
MLGLLNISEAMSIAMHACVWLADDPERFLSARQISAKLGFSPHHCAKVVQQLVRTGILETERGPAGGARLARSPGKITILDIYIATGGNLTYKGCLLKRNICKGDGCTLGKLMAKENKRLVGLLKNATLASVVRSLKKNRIG